VREPPRGALRRASPEHAESIHHPRFAQPFTLERMTFFERHPLYLFV
jgi:hypothetical protein